MVVALLAIKDMTCQSMDSVSYQQVILNFLIWVAVNGTGTIKLAFNVPTDGLSMQTKCALLSVINARHGIQMVYALLVSRAMI